ncbi:MAG TPA: hemolysin III family protein [Beijerinckiaceae bacterium]|nr:hemolysin III family protein [Beijerinckiaceae bacterium]
MSAGDLSLTEGSGLNSSAPDLSPRARRYAREERLADLLVHLVGLAAALAGAVALLVSTRPRTAWALAPIGVYAVALIATFAASAAYNLAFDSRFRPLLRRLDHSAIFLMIAGTYTPFTTRLVAGWAAVVATAWIWSMALGGIALKLISPRLFERLAVLLYLALGWAALALYPPLAAALHGWPFVLLLAGGALYSFGLCFHLREHMRFHNAIWHVFVLAAASCQYTTILTSVAMH